jgi:multicomponent Na+:H+ antiporter subunit E
VTRFAVAVVVLAAVYMAALASADPGDLAVGVALAAGVLATGRRFLFEHGLPPLHGLAGRVVGFPVFAAAVVADVTAGTWSVALIMLGVRSPRDPRIVEIPIGDRSRVGVAVTALTGTLSPGEVLVDVDEPRGVMLVHVIDGADPEAVIAHHRRFYERYQRRVFP